MSSIQVNEVSTSWSSTDAGMTAYFNCGDIDGYESGYISRQCNDEGEWSDEVVGHCIMSVPSFKTITPTDFATGNNVNVVLTCADKTICDVPDIVPDLPSGWSISFYLITIEL